VTATPHLVGIVAPYAAPPHVTAARDQLYELEGWVRLGCLLVAAAALLLAAQGVHALWHGERMLRARPTPISAIRAGRVVLSGVVEPAWSVLRSPFSRRICVWYNGKSTSGLTFYGSLVWDYRERNAVAFLLNDGTGRVLVLGRRARWDSGNSRLDLGAANRAIREGACPEETLDIRADQLEHPPEPLLRMGRFPLSGPDQVVAVGERVTVVGRATPDDRGILPVDACPDSGEAFGLPGLYRVGPDGLRGLGVMAGSARDVTVRGRLRLLLGSVGLSLLLACVATNVLLPPDHVLPPSGTVVFGTSFDPYAGVQGQNDAFSLRQPVVAVSGLPGVHDGDRVTVMVDREVVATWTASDLGNRLACRIDFAAGDLAVGSHVVEVFADIFGTTRLELAVGRVAIEP
jgi:hypothetical protein